MEIVTNDMIPDGKFKNKYEAIKSIRECLKMLTEIRNKTSFVKLSASANVFRGMELAEGYYFEQLFNENIELLPQKDKALLRTLLVNFNMIKLPEGKFIYRGKESKNCVWVHMHQGLVFSIPIEPDMEEKFLSGKFVLADGKEKDVMVPNLSKIEHLEVHQKRLGIRKYEFNPKHKVNVGWGTEMDLNDAEAQELLLRALPVDEKESHLVAKKNGRYYSFRCHYGNCYHGYWDNTMPEKNRRIADGIV